MTDRCLVLKKNLSYCKTRKSTVSSCKYSEWEVPLYCSRRCCRPVQTVRVRALLVCTRSAPMSPQGVSLLADLPISSLCGFISYLRMTGQKLLKLYDRGGVGWGNSLQLENGSICNPNCGVRAKDAGWLLETAVAGQFAVRSSEMIVGHELDIKRWNPAWDCHFQQQPCMSGQSAIAEGTGHSALGQLPFTLRGACSGGLFSGRCLRFLARTSIWPCASRTLDGPADSDCPLNGSLGFSFEIFFSWILHS